MNIIQHLFIFCILFCFICSVRSLHIVESSIPEDLKIAFEKDGFNIARCIEGPKGKGRGCLALSINASTYSTKKPKPAMYLEATESYDIGFMYGALVDKEDANSIATTFIERIIVDLIDAQWAEKHWNTTLYKEVFSFISWIITTEGIRVFDEQVKQGNIFPKGIIDEMNGFLDGTKSNNPDTKVTRDSIISINYAFDVFSARVFSGDIIGLLLEDRLSTQYYELKEFLKNTPRSHWPFIPPAACDALGIKGKWTKSKEDVYFGRALQFKTADIMQDTFIVQIIVRPGTSYLPMTSVVVPGLVGTMAGVNSAGVSMGFDTIRAPNANNKQVGINSMLLTRTILEKYSSTVTAVDAIASSPRGCPYLYPLCDASGECAVLEAGAYLPDGQKEDPLQYVEDLLKWEQLVPSRTYLSEHSTNTFKNGLYVRWMNYTDPPIDSYFNTFNPNLFKHAGIEYNPNTMNLGTYLFPTWQKEMELERILDNDYFFPQKEQDDELVAVSNFPFVPESRLTMMSFIDDFIASTGEAPTWRYESLLNMSYTFKGEINFDLFKWIMQFLSPDRAPGYWHNYYDPSNHMTAVVEGVISIFDLKNRVQFVRSGYWIDNMIHIHLLNYLNNNTSSLY